MTAQQMDKVKEGEKKGAAAIVHAHGPLELAPCPGGPDPAGPPFRSPERGRGGPGTPRARSTGERCGGRGTGGGAAVGRAVAGAAAGEEAAVHAVTHSLPCIEAWLRSLGFTQSRDDPAV